MYIQKTFKNKIASTFYDKVVYLLNKSTTIDVEGGVTSTGLTNKGSFKGNVNYSNCKQIQEDYGLDYNIDLSITTNYNGVKINNLIKYQDVVYNVTDVINSDSHVLLVATKWRQ